MSSKLYCCNETIVVYDLGIILYKFYFKINL